MGDKYALSKTTYDKEKNISRYPNLPFQIFSGTLVNPRTF